MSDKYAELRNHIWGKRRIIRDLLDERDALVEWQELAFIAYPNIDEEIEAAKRQEDT